MRLLCAHPGYARGMALPDVDTALGWRGHTVVDPQGEELGKVTELYLDGASQRPAWAGVKRGLLRAKETIVPLEGAEEVEGRLRVAYDRERVDSAPDVDPDVELAEEEERLLHEHYGREWAPPSGQETDTAMTRSEEEVEMRTRVKRHRSEEHTSELQSRQYLVCRLLLEKKELGDLLQTRVPLPGFF